MPSIKTEVSGSTDEHSGFKQYLYLVTNSSDIPNKFASGFTTSKAFTRNCGKSYYAWAVAEDKVGNRSEVVSLGNTKDEEDKYSEWNSCSALCGGGSQSRTNTCELITENLVQDCNTMDCCSSVSYKDGSTCSKSCGGGTRNRLAYSNYNKQRCSGQDKASGGSSCNTQSCVPTYSCNIRGNSIRYQNYTWVCTRGHEHTSGYTHYCSDGAGNLYTKDTNPSLVTYRWVCPTALYGEADGWTIISD